MRTIIPRTHFACRNWQACVHCLHERLVCATMSVRPPASGGHQAPAGMPARTHALHVPIIACKFYPRAWSLRGAGSGLRSTCLAGCVINLSLIRH